MSAGVRERVWAVLADWFGNEPDQAIVMTWPDRAVPGGQAFLTLGVPRVDLVERDDIFLARRDLNEQELRSLTKESRAANAETA
jgi:CRISPR-associated protein Cas2